MRRIRFQILLGAAVFCALATPPSRAQQKVDLKSTTVATTMMEVLTGIGKGNRRNANVERLYLDLKTGELSGTVKIFNKQVVKHPLGGSKVVWDYTLSKDFVLDLNEQKPNETIDFGKQVGIEYSALCLSLGAGKDWCLLSVESEPTQATIHINGQEWGTTKLDGFTDAGKYKLKLVKDGFVPLEAEVNLKKGEANPFFYKLQAKP